MLTIIFLVLVSHMVVQHIIVLEFSATVTADCWVRHVCRVTARPIWTRTLLLVLLNSPLKYNCSTIWAFSVAIYVVELDVPKLALKVRGIVLTVAGMTLNDVFILVMHEAGVVMGGGERKHFLADTTLFLLFEGIPEAAVLVIAEEQVNGIVCFHGMN